MSFQTLLRRIFGIRTGFVLLCGLSLLLLVFALAFVRMTP